jgi:cellobiose-specific phosphotransferase system component IIA
MKAFSYCQTVVKNYLMFKRMQVVKEQQRNTPYDTVSDTFENDTKYSTEVIDSYVLAEKLIAKTSNEIRKMLENAKENGLTEKEIKVGYALCDLFEDNKWEQLIRDDDSNKLLKSSVLMFLREATLMTTKEIRDNCKPYKTLYFLLKKNELE